MVAKAHRKLLLEGTRDDLGNGSPIFKCSRVQVNIAVSPSTAVLLPSKW